jgi:hypothetical protein
VINNRGTATLSGSANADASTNMVGEMNGVE